MLQLFEYELPFRSSFQTGSSEFKTRKGVLLHYREGEIDFVVEASPLPGFSRESFSDVRQTLLDQKKQVENFLKDELNIQTIRNLTSVKELGQPSVQFSLSFLSLSVLANRQGKTIYDLFGQQTPQKILMNDVIGHGPVQEMQHQIEESIQEGFQVLKIKAVQPLDELASLLRIIHKKHPGVQFRLDANQSWPKENSSKNFALLKNLPIEYIEEPCRINDWTDVGEIQKISPFPIALDESISTIDELNKALKQFPDLTIILKPVLLGNFLEIHETIFRFRSSFKKIVVTTTLESKIGRSIIASAASLIGDHQMRHGLHTGHLLTDDLLPDFEIENGSIINLPNNPAIKSFSDIKTSYFKNLG